jgi:hypothetical protein
MSTIHEEHATPELDFCPFCGSGYITYLGWDDGGGDYADDVTEQWSCDECGRCWGPLEPPDPRDPMGPYGPNNYTWVGPARVADEERDA